MRRVQSLLPRVLHDQHAFRPKKKREQGSEHWLRPSCVTAPRIHRDRAEGNQLLERERPPRRHAQMTGTCPGPLIVESIACTRVPSGRRATYGRASSNLQFDILPDGDFRHDCRRFVRAAPLPAVVVRFVIALRTTCSRGSAPPVDQRGHVFTWAVMDPQDRHRDRPRRQSSTSRATTSLPKPSDGRYSRPPTDQTSSE
jgi:hypothetical protein